MNIYISMQRYVNKCNFTTLYLILDFYKGLIFFYLLIFISDRRRDYTDL